MSTKLNVLLRRLAQATAFESTAGRIMGNGVCWGVSRLNVLANPAHTMVLLTVNKGSDLVEHCICVDRSGNNVRDTATDRGKQAGTVEGSPGNYRVKYNIGTYHQIAGLTGADLRKMASEWTGGDAHIAGSTTTVRAYRLKRAIRASSGTLQKTDLELMLEYIVENMINNPVGSEELEADIYHKPITRFAGFDIRVENPRGTYRSGTDAQGTPWKNLMYNTYGEFMSTIAVDGDPVDVFLGDRQDCRDVFIVHQAQKDNWAKYDEDKIMLGFMSMEEALTAYLRHYNGDKRFIMQVTVMSRPVFKAKLLNDHSGNLTGFRSIA